MSTIPPDAPGLAEADRELAAAAIGLELAIRDLYDSIRERDDGELWMVLREQHESYATNLAGVSGVQADTRDEDLYGQFEALIGDDLFAGAREVENIAAATHTTLVGQVTENPLAASMAGIAIMESRHALVLAVDDAAVADDDFDVLFQNPELEV